MNILFNETKSVFDIFYQVFKYFTAIQIHIACTWYAIFLGMKYCIQTQNPNYLPSLHLTCSVSNSAYGVMEYPLMKRETKRGARKILFPLETY